jgi:hypothetical protein
VAFSVIQKLKGQETAAISLKGYKTKKTIVSAPIAFLSG